MRGKPAGSYFPRWDTQIRERDRAFTGPVVEERFGSRNTPAISELAVQLDLERRVGATQHHPIAPDQLLWSTGVSEQARQLGLRMRGGRYGVVECPSCSHDVDLSPVTPGEVHRCSVQLEVAAAWQGFLDIRRLDGIPVDHYERRFLCIHADAITVHACCHRRIEGDLGAAEHGLLSRLDDHFPIRGSGNQKLSGCLEVKMQSLVVLQMSIAKAA